MHRLGRSLRKFFTSRVGLIATAVTLSGAVILGTAMADGDSGAVQYILLDDLANNQYPEPQTGSGDSSDDSGDDSGSGHDNNGHGNNEDGVDSSNKGQGGGGPNGDVDESCDGTGECVDDEAGHGMGSGSGSGSGNGNGSGSGSGSGDSDSSSSKGKGNGH